MKPKLRPIALYEMKSALDGFMLKQIERADIYPFQSCLNCTWFAEASEKCGLFPQAGRPPAKVIAFGCEKWDDMDGIPF